MTEVTYRALKILRATYPGRYRTEIWHGPELNAAIAQAKTELGL